MKKFVALASVFIFGGVLLMFVGTNYEKLPNMLRYASLIGFFLFVLGIGILGAVCEVSEKKIYEETHIERRL